MKIYKYQINRSNLGRVRMHKGAEVLTARHQASCYGHGFMLWARVNPSQPMETRQFDIVPTGADVELTQVYRSTIEMPSGEILHIFETPL